MLKRVAVATLSAVIALEAVGLAWSAISIWLLKRTDPKWGDAWGNFTLAVQLLQVEAVGTLLVALAVFAIARRVFQQRSVAFAIVLGLLVGVSEYVLRFADWFQIARAVGLRDPLKLPFVAVVPGALAAGVWTLLVRNRAWGKVHEQGVA